MRLIARIDDNQAEIVGVLREAGARVFCTHQLGQGFPDLLVGWQGVLMLLEIKDGDKPPSKRKLTPDEQAFFAAWAGYPVHVVENPLQALVLLGCEATTKDGILV